MYSAGGVSSPGQLFAAIMEQRNGIVDQRRFDPHWDEDLFRKARPRSLDLLPRRHHRRPRDSAPSGIEQAVFNRFSRTQRLLCIALAPCVNRQRTADRVMCIIGATADGFEDQDAVSSLHFAGIDPASHDVKSG